MKPYAQYKPSGVKWIGEMPKNWELKRVKHITSHNTGWTPQTGNREYYDGENLWATIADIGNKVIVDTKSRISDDAIKEANIKPSPIKSLLFSFKLSVGQVSIVGTPLYTNEAIATFIPNDHYVVGWAYYAFPVFIPENSAINIYGARLLNQQRINDAFLPVPSKTEQQSIADYLDTEVERIESLINEKIGLIELLTEAVESNVSELISGGTLSGTKSGNEWIPHLPNGWQLKRLKHLGKVRSGIAKGKDTEGKKTIEMPYLRVANVQDGYLNLSEISTIEVDEEVVGSYLLQKGDVLMNEGGDYDKVGRGARWDGQISPCIHQNHVFAVRPEDSDMSEWLAAILQTKYAKYYFMNNAKQSTNLASISQSNIKELPVLVPPKDVRTKILRQVDDEAKKLKDLITHTEGEIELLEELRAATIADAVLGRIDVRTQSHH